MPSAYSPFLVDIKITENTSDHYLRLNYDSAFRILAQRSSLNNFQISQSIWLSLELSTEIFFTSIGLGIKAYNV